MSSVAERGVVVCEPASPEELAAYYRLRWEVIAKPFGRPPEFDRDPLDDLSVHLVARDAAGRVIGAGAYQLRRHRARRVLGGRVKIPRLGPWHSGFIRRLAVDERARGAGVGQALMDEMERRLLRAGARVFWVHARVSAAGFYKRRGYHVFGPGYGPPPHYMMRKRVARMPWAPAARRGGG
jgi:ribosomal protein S18 acetylase RimI-like enzyme